MSLSNGADEQATITVIHCWSAPRSRSTAFLYSWEARQDCFVLDEPLYREWLISKGDAAQRPYQKCFIDGVPPEGDEANRHKWERELLSLKERIEQGIAAKKSVIFCKQMAKWAFLYDRSEFEKQTFEGVPDGTVVVHKHMLLIRDPLAILSSWDDRAEVHNATTLDEVGMVPLMTCYSDFIATGGDDTSNIIVLDSDDLLSDPASTLSSLCDELGIPYDPHMLHWKPGPHDCDGPWAKWWYEAVHKSSGWKQKDPWAPLSTYRTLNPKFVPILRASNPAYTFLKSLTRNHYSSQRSGSPTAQLPNPVDPRNQHILVYTGAPRGQGRLVPRDQARVSPWDASIQDSGDAIWESIPLQRAKLLNLDKHLRRLVQSAKALGFQNAHTKDEIVEAVFRTLAANGMRDGACVRITLTRGEKCASGVDPRFNVYGTTLIVLAEWKATPTCDEGISLITASQRRHPVGMNNNNNNVQPKMQAGLAGCADAILLDVDGYVLETIAASIFLVNDEGTLVAPPADHGFPGIPRTAVLQLASELEIPYEVRRVSLSEFHAAEEVFTAGTMGDLTPVTRVDGRVIGTEQRGPVTAKLQEICQTLPEREGWATPIPEFV